MQLLWGITAGASGAILLIWIGYPIAVWLLAQVMARPIAPDPLAAARRRVSIVLATRERPDMIAERVRNLLDTDHPDELLEVIIALDADGSQSSLESLEGMGSHVRATMGDAPGGKACALNAGVRAATGEVLVLADAAQRFDRQTIPVLVAAMEDGRFGAVSGALTLGASTGMSPVHWYWAMEKWLRYNESLLHSSIGVTGAVYATRKALWPDPPAGTLLDDVYVPMALVLRGLRVGFAPSAHAVDSRTFDSTAEKTRKTRTLTGVLQLVSLLPILSVRNSVLLQFAFHKLARLATPLLVIAVLLASTSLGIMYALQRPLLASAVVSVCALVLLVVPALRKKLGQLLRWGWSLQEAMLTAVTNGARGRWGVWSRSK